MNDQPAVLPAQPPRRLSTLVVVLVAVLGVGVAVFGLLSAILYANLDHSRKTVVAEKSTAAAAARAQQLNTDTAANELAQETPYRSYTAPIAAGSFEIKFPKNWASYVDEEASGNQVTLLVNPDFVRRTNGTDMLIAAKVTLTERSSVDIAKSYSSNKKLTAKNVVVSGITATAYEGNFGDKRTVRLVVVPVRDKSMMFTNENATYASQFDEIVAQAKINP